MPDPVAIDPAVRGVLGRPFAQQVAFFRGKLGNLVPTETWTDMLRGAHDRAFMVAGAQKADLLSGLAAAVDRAITEGRGIGEFRKDFRALVERSGWSYTGEFNWRTRTIYTTNISTSYAAGRLAQLREGGFGWYTYRHSDSVLHPRPLHLSWNGLTLAASDPWWTTHFPPNGWGCRCRVVGVRKPEDAARYGEVKRQAPNDGIDAKTGAPAGIDAGWDYMPGNTVSSTVSAMAEKTRHWDYALAKAYMQGVPASVRDQLAVAYRDLPSVANDVRLHAQRVLENRAVEVMPPYRTMGLVTTDQAGTIKTTIGAEVADFDFAVDRFAPIHIRDSHGNQALEDRRGQRAVVATDYALLPELINAPDVIEAAGKSWSTGHPLVRYRKRFGSEEMVAVFERRGQRRSLVLDSMYVVRVRP